MFNIKKVYLLKRGNVKIYVTNNYKWRALHVSSTLSSYDKDTQI